jgi:hypothetical protein
LKSSFLQAGAASFPAMVRIADRKVVEMWHVQNTTGLLQQLGAVVPTASKIAGADFTVLVRHQLL